MAEFFNSTGDESEHSSPPPQLPRKKPAVAKQVASEDLEVEARRGKRARKPSQKVLQTAEETVEVKKKQMGKLQKDIREMQAKSRQANCGDLGTNDEENDYESEEPIDHSQNHRSWASHA